MIVLDGQSFTIEKAQAAAQGAKIAIDHAVRKNMDLSRAIVKKASRQRTPVYAVNTGLGHFARIHIPKKQQLELQVNILKSHAAGWGPPLSIEETRLAMACRLNTLLKEFSGVTFALCQALLDLVNHGIYPIIPEHGSVGASGDLAPLAHLALPLIGEGVVRYREQTLSASEALKQAGLKPYQLSEKEGVALINGTQMMLSVGTLACLQAISLLDHADRIAALSYEALIGNPEALDPRIHRARRQLGQIESANAILTQLKGSYLFNKNLQRIRVQDPYSLRCAPQIHGPSRDALRHVREIIEKELNAATDNPLVIQEEERLVSGGNFHGQNLAMAFDYAAMAIAEIGNVSERRLELLLNPHFSGLPPFLTPREGINSGYMASQYLSASLVNENKLLANPSCTDSIPGNVGIEDHVSMGMTSARKLKKLVKNAQAILAVEMMAAAQAIDLRQIEKLAPISHQLLFSKAGEKWKLGAGTSKTYASVREKIPQLVEDRIISDDIQQAVNILRMA